MTSSKKDVWQFRFKNPMDGKYLRRSSGETGEHEAAAVALDTYEDFKVKHRLGAPEEKSTITNMIDRYKDELKPTGIKSIEAFFKLYWIKYFGDKDLYAISDDDIKSYWKWRVDYWESKDGEYGIPGKTPSRPRRNAQTRSTTLEKEKGLMKWLFRKSFEKRMIAIMPSFPRDFHGYHNVVMVPDTRRRGRFTHGKDGDYRIVENALGQIRRQLGMEIKDHPDWRYRHPMKRYDKANLWVYLLLIANSGIRPQEARRLQWRDIDGGSFGLWTDDDGETYTYINIRKSVSKIKRQRDVITRDFRATYDRLMIWKKEWIRMWKREPEPTDLVFPQPDQQYSDAKFNQPRQMTHMVKNFHRSLKVYEEVINGERVPRTSYSYRSYFITSRIFHGMDVYNLSRLCGTSVDMIAKYYDLNLNLQHRQEITKHLKWEKRNPRLEEVE